MARLQKNMIELKLNEREKYLSNVFGGKLYDSMCVEDYFQHME